MQKDLKRFQASLQRPRARGEGEGGEDVKVVEEQKRNLAGAERKLAALQRKQKVGSPLHHLSSNLPYLTLPSLLTLPSPPLPSPPLPSPPLPSPPSAGNRKSYPVWKKE